MLLNIYEALGSYLHPALTNLEDVFLVIQKNYMWNTVTIQYNPLIEEEWDEHFKVQQTA